MLDAAFVASAVLAAPAIAALTGLVYVSSLERGLLPSELAVAGSVEALRLRGWAEPPAWSTLALEAPRRRWAAPAEVARQDEECAELLTSSSSDDAARVRSCSGPGSAWLYAAVATGEARPDDPPPDPSQVSGPALERFSANALHVEDRDAGRLMRFRLGLAVGRAGPCGRRTTMPSAKKAECDVAECSPKHLVTCPCGGWVRARHDRLARQLQLLALEIPGTEVDWVPVTPEWPQEGGEPGQPDLLIRVPGWAPDARATTPGAAAMDVEGRKRAKYPVWRDRVRASPHDFCPFVLEAYGWFGGETADLLRRLVRRSAMDRGLAESAELRRWTEVLSVQLALEQSRILAHD
jgi:hypothetical protein